MFPGNRIQDIYYNTTIYLQWKDLYQNLIMYQMKVFHLHIYPRYCGTRSEESCSTKPGSFEESGLHLFFPARSEIPTEKCF